MKEIRLVRAAIFLVLGFAAAGYLLGATWQIYRFAQLKASTVGVVSVVSVEQTGSDRFQLDVSYTYSYGGERLSGRSLMGWPRFRNAAAARFQAEELSEEELTVWLDPTSPKVSSLEHAFPYKACAYALILLGVFLYFLWLSSSSQLVRTSKDNTSA